MQRRDFLKIMGSTAAIAAATSAGCGTLRRPSIALAPWDDAGSIDYDDPRVSALSYAILAPNPHNRQAWIIDLAVQGEATLYCDLDRRLPDTDPFDRQTTIGLGCFLELLSIASAELGLDTEVSTFPNGSDDARLDERPVAHIRFSSRPAIDRDSLFAHVLARRSNKNPFEKNRSIPQDALDSVCQTGLLEVDSQAISDPVRAARLRELTWEALRTELSTPHVMQESIDLMRIGKKEINENPDGLSFGGSMFEFLHMMGLFSREALQDQDSIAFKQGLSMSREQLMSASSYVWVSTSSNTREDQLNAGRAWLRINLRATSLGLDLQPLSQALQEYPEMESFYEQVHDELGVHRPAVVQMLGRIGYGPEADRTPRWPITSRIRKST